LASLSLNAASSPAKKLDGQKRTPSQKPASAKNKKHGQKETALPKPTLLVFREEKPEVTFSDTIPLDPQPESNTSDGVVELPSELESVLKSLSALVGAPSSALADLADCLTEVPGRQAILSGTAGPCLLAQALRLAAAGGAPPNVGDGLLRLVTRLALEGGERTDEDVGGEVSSRADGNLSETCLPDEVAGALCEAGVPVAVVLHLRPVPSKDGCGGSLAAGSAGAATEALAALTLGPAGATAVARTPGLLAAAASLLESGASCAASRSAAATAESALAFLATLAFHEPAAVADSGASRKDITN
jgi:hypothetical protein